MDRSDFLAFTCTGTLPPEYERLDDAVVHESCLIRWKHRDDFKREWNTAVSPCFSDGKRYMLICDGERVKYQNR